MQKRFVSIWFRHLATDWFALRDPSLKTKPFVLRKLIHGRMIITAVNHEAKQQGVHAGMVLADAKVFLHDLQVHDEIIDLNERLLKKLAEWCIRFSPCVEVNLPDGLLIDASGCAHLWGGEEHYIHHIVSRLNKRGYAVSISIADTIGAAWAGARFGISYMESGKHEEVLMKLPPEALRIEPDICQRLHQLGLRKIGLFIHMKPQLLRRRFGAAFIQRLHQATGNEAEVVHPVIPIEPYQERIACMEPIATATGIEIALQELLETLCLRLRLEQKGLRTALYQCHRVDGKIESIQIATHRPTHHVKHVFKLFQNKITSIEPALGIELFVLTAMKVEEHLSQQEKIWESSLGVKDERLAELIDRMANKVGIAAIQRYLPDEHYWPERSFRPATFIQESSASEWRSDKLRPLRVLPAPERIEVTALLPDHPPILFRYKGNVHNVIKADGPERIEQEWWLQTGQHRDYYRVEDEAGHRYWVFRLGHYHDKQYQWFIHGFFP